MNFGSDECTEISLVWNQLIFILSCFEACGVQRFHLQKVCVRDWFCILPTMKKSMALFHIKNFSYHVTLTTYKKKTSTCGSQVGHMWVTSGLFCGSVGQMGQQVWPTFNPCISFISCMGFWIGKWILRQIHCTCTMIVSRTSLHITGYKIYFKGDMTLCDTYVAYCLYYKMHLYCVQRYVFKYLTS